MAEIGLPDPEYSEPNNFMVKLVLRNNIRQCVPYLNDTEGMTIRKVIAELGYPSEGGAGEMGSRGSARRGLHADERVPVDAPLPQRGDTGPDERKKRTDAR